MNKLYKLLYKSLLIYIVFISGTSLSPVLAQAVSLDLMASENCEGQIIARIFVKTDTNGNNTPNELLLGSSSIFLNYDTSALEFSSYQPENFHGATSSKSKAAGWGNQKWTVNDPFGIFSLVLLKNGKGKNNYDLVADGPIEVGVLTFNTRSTINNENSIVANSFYTHFYDIDDELLPVGDIGNFTLNSDCTENLETTTTCGDEITIKYRAGNIVLEGLEGNDYQFYVFDESWKPIYSCDSNCGNIAGLGNLDAITYKILVGNSESGVFCLEEITLPTSLPNDQVQEEQTQRKVNIGLTSIGLNREYDLDRINVFPNPATDEVFVALNDLGGQSGTLSIINHFGQIINQYNLETMSQTPFRINTSALSSGLYHIHIKANNQMAITKKVLIHRR